MTPEQRAEVELSIAHALLQHALDDWSDAKERIARYQDRVDYWSGLLKKEEQ